MPEEKVLTSGQAERIGLADGIFTINYNGEKFIRMALKSVMLQTFEDWELLVVNDASTDNSLAVVQEFDDPRIRYFSGTVTYRNDFVLDTLSGRTVIDLGDVRNLAQVAVNGKDCGVVWTSPFRMDISGHVKVGKNELEVKVTNLWVNRLIGDSRPDVELPVTYAGFRHYKGTDPLLSSGLIGEVRILSLTETGDPVENSFF